MSSAENSKDKTAPAQPPKAKKAIFSEYFQAFLGAILLAILIRGFVFEPFKIPSESMVPTLLVGDHIFVKRYAYGLRVPIPKLAVLDYVFGWVGLEDEYNHLWLAEFDDPKRGDVVVFSFPHEQDVDFIKRVIGVPGDTISMKSGELYVNGQKVEEQDLTLQGKDQDNKCWMSLSDDSKTVLPDKLEPYPYYRHVRQFQPKMENLPDGIQHYVQRSKFAPVESEFELVVPPRQFFVLGDNRDQSKDSRFWGFVPRENLKGKAEVIWLSLNYEGVSCSGIDLGVRWDRFGRKII